MWKAALPVMSQADFLDRIMTFDRDSVSDEDVELLYPYRQAPDFNFESAKKVSTNVAGLCVWVDAMCQYVEISKVVKPKIAQLKTALSALAAANKKLDAAKAELDVVQGELNAMQAQFDAAMAEKAAIQADADATQRRSDAANRLIGGLAGEQPPSPSSPVARGGGSGSSKRFEQEVQREAAKAVHQILASATLNVDSIIEELESDRGGAPSPPGGGRLARMHSSSEGGGDGAGGGWGGGGWGGGLDELRAIDKALLGALGKGLIRVIRCSFLLRQADDWVLPRLQELRETTGALLEPAEAAQLLMRAADRSILALSQCVAHPSTSLRREPLSSFALLPSRTSCPPGLLASCRLLLTWRRVESRRPPVPVAG